MGSESGQGQSCHFHILVGQGGSTCFAPPPPLVASVQHRPYHCKHIKWEWDQVELVLPGHQPKDVTTHRWSHPLFYIIVSALSEQWTVKRLVVATYPAYFQNNCYSLIVIPSGLASEREYWIFSFIWITWVSTSYPISFQSHPFSVVAHHCLL